MIFGVASIDPKRRDELIKVLDIDISWSLHKVSDGQRRCLQICMGLLKPVKVKGSAGYVDPDYLRTFQLTDLSDVYSHGVLLIELLTGRCPIEFKNHEALKRLIDDEAFLRPVAEEKQSCY
ncbi:unnamed protein product [Microthlaspi erraticum]|uniref:Protein kinase domain-containing protein n=1 Tax=Microthlaspi erraticum TaxID=1685480 RepID=A0A6D2HP30_9BRAS|nr:unnamed protein product [Microthlaspi erraticum]